MKTIGLRSDFASFVYRLETATPYIPVASAEPSLLRLPDNKVTE